MKCYLAIFLLFANFPSLAQRLIDQPDSLPVSKPRMARGTYILHHPIGEELSIKVKNAKPATKQNRGIIGGVVTLLTGLSTFSDDESVWLLPCELESKDSLHWKVHVFVSAVLLKDTERVANDDGSFSLVTEKSLIIDWHKEVTAFIIDDADTLGMFYFDTRFQEDEEPLLWRLQMEAERSGHINRFRKFRTAYLFHDFHLTGFLAGKNFSIIRSGKLFRSLILVEDKPVAIFQSDPDFIITGKKYRIMPYLLVDKDRTDVTTRELFRLSMLSRLMSTVMSLHPGRQ